MKKVLLILVAVFGFAFAANAQDNAIGARLGASFGQGYHTTGAEISYQRALGASRLEFDLGWNNIAGIYSYYSFTGLYQYTFPINAVPNLGWYVGAGPRLNLLTYSGGANVSLGICGQVGVDYHFDAIPLQLSLDVRPTFYLYPSTEFVPADVALGIRYMF